MNDLLGKRLENARIQTVLPHIKGKLLDIGCGNNNLSKIYGNGSGVDVYDWGSVDIIVKDSSEIPMKDGSIDTITILAALNHIPNRESVIEESYRLLRENGRVIITMIPPKISRIWHFLRKPWDVDQTERGMKEGELYGMTKKDIIKIFEINNFELLETKTFMFGINQFFIFQKVN